MLEIPVKKRDLPLKKLINGIVAFRQNLQPVYRETFARLALGQSPDALFIGCSDSRVAVNVFASTDPGDLFVIRNVGNLVPPCQDNGKPASDDSVAAAIEFAVGTLNVSNIIVCGHSECGAMQALTAGIDNVKEINLRSWLKNGNLNPNVDQENLKIDASLSKHNKYSQQNVLLQLEHLKTYPIIASRIKSGRLALHGWWFDLKQADVYAYEETFCKFKLFDEEEAQRILNRL